MYLRMMNKLDVSCMKEAIQEDIKNPAIFEKVFGRISDAITSLDEAYGEGSIEYGRLCVPADRYP